jgi:hypothetical protein
MKQRGRYETVLIDFSYNCKRDSLLSCPLFFKPNYLQIGQTILLLSLDENITRLSEFMYYAHKEEQR